MRRFYVIFSALLLTLVMAPSEAPGGQAEGSRRSGKSGTKLKLQGYILEIKADRLRLEDGWVRLTSRTKVFRHGVRDMTSEQLKPRWQVNIDARRESDDIDPVATKIWVRTPKNPKVKLSGFLEIKDQGWEGFSVPEVRWDFRELDGLDDESGDWEEEDPRDRDKTGSPDDRDPRIRRERNARVDRNENDGRDDDDEDAGGFRDLRHHELILLGRPVAFKEDANLYGRGYTSIPYRLLYPGMLVELQGELDEESGTINIKTLHAKYERPDPLEYQIRQESELDIRRLTPGLALYSDPRFLRRIEKIGARLVPPYASLNDQVPPLKFEVLASEKPVSFAMPDGTIYISAGLIAVLPSEEALAAVLAYEISHICLRHFVRAMNRKQGINLWDIGTFAGTIAFGPFVSVLGPMIKVATYRGLKVLPFAMLHRFHNDYIREADQYAVDFLIHAGYDPGALLMLENYLKARLPETATKKGKAPPFFWVDHRRWDIRRHRLMRELSYRSPGSLDYINREDIAYDELVAPLRKAVLETIEAKEEPDDHDLAILRVLGGGNAAPETAAPAESDAAP